MLETVRVDDLRALPAMASATLLGGAAALGSPVTDVMLVEPEQVMSCELAAEAAVVFAIEAGPGAVHRQHLLDLLLRRAHNANATAVIVVGMEGAVPIATCRLADRLRLPTLVASVDLTPLELAVELRVTVLAPQAEQGRMLVRLALSLETTTDLPQVLAAVASAIDAASVSACTAQGVVFAGPTPTTPLARIVAARSAVFFEEDGVSSAVLPVTGIGSVPSLWVVAERRDTGLLWRRIAVQALTLARGGILGWLAQRQSEAERDARLRSTLLTEILEHGEAIAKGVVEQATMAGWQLSGWHTGIHFRFPEGSAVPAFAADTLATRLANAGVHLNALVERTDGWSTWLTSADAPGPGHARRLGETLTALLTDGSAWLGDLTVGIGIGSPQRDVPGIAATLAEARQAAAIAASSGKPVSSRVVQDLGASRLLLGWYSSGAFGDYAAQMLRPLLDSAETEVLTTLEAYLDRSCSAMQTARVLGIHRNTVTQRIARAERILGTSLAHSDTRLALQLALRVAHTSPTALQGQSKAVRRPTPGHK